MARLDCRIASLALIAWCGAVVAVRAQAPSTAGALLGEASISDQDGPPQLALVSPVAFTQVVSQPAGPPPTPRHTGLKAMLKDLGEDFLHLPSTENLFWAGVGGGLALAAHPFDDNVHES